jgi:hypothetical protein
LGFFLDLHSGLIIGIIVAWVFFILFSFFGEKFVLYFSSARYVSDDEKLINQVKNFSCHLGLSGVRVFSSARFSNNVYYTNSYFGKPTLIIGKNVLLNLSKHELHSLIFASLLRLKSPDSKSRTMVSLMLLILFSPVFWVRKFLVKNPKSFMDVFLYPGYFLKGFMYSSPALAIKLDREVASLEGLRKDYISAIFKLSRLEASPIHTVGDFILCELTHIPNKERDVLFDLVMGDQNTTERIEALAGF